jgi:hypothetical protein
VSWNFLKREWGAVTFVLTVLIGLIVVPIALYLESQGPQAVVASTPTPSGPASAASTARRASAASAASTPRPATPTPTPTKTP